MDQSTRLKDYYKVLGVRPEASVDEIRKAYRKLARKFHPDRNKAADAEDRFKEVGEAWEVLKDEQRRATYDQIRAGGPIPGFGGGPGGFQGAGDADMSSLFEQLFGGLRGATGGGGGFGGFGGFGGAGGAGARPGGRRAPPHSRGADREASVEIDLETAYRGGKQRMTIDGRSLDVTIPAGTGDGQKIRLKGQGDPWAGGAGDLILTVRLRAHPTFRLEGRDLHRRLDIAPWEAARGARVPVETLSGTLELKVPSGARSGQKLRARGRGMPGSPAGDLLVELMIQTPPASDGRIEELYEELEQRSGFMPRRG